MNAHTFRTKRGYCHVLPDKIFLSGTEDDMPSSIPPPRGENALIRAVPIYLLILGCYIALSLQDNRFELPEIVFASLFGVFVGYRIVTNWNTSVRNIIDRSTIERVVFKEGIRYVTVSRFEVYFRHGNGTLKKRIITFPGELTPDPEQKKKGIRIFTEAGLLADQY